MDFDPTIGSPAYLDTNGGRNIEERCLFNGSTTIFAKKMVFGSSEGLGIPKGKIQHLEYLQNETSLYKLCGP